MEKGAGVKRGCLHPDSPARFLLSAHFPLRATRAVPPEGQDPNPEKESLAEKSQSKAGGQQEERKMNFQGIKANSAT